MRKIKLMCVALILVGSIPSSPVWAGRGHGHHGHHHHGHHNHGHHHHRGGYGGIGLALGMGLLGFGLGYYGGRAPSHPPAYGYPPAGYPPSGYGYAPRYSPPAPPVYIQQQWR